MCMEYRLTGAFAGVGADVKSRNAGIMGTQALARAMHESIGGVDFCRAHFEVVDHVPSGNDHAVTLGDGITVV